MHMYRDPYLSVQNPSRMMRGKDAPRSTVFGVLGVGGGASAGVGVGGKSLGGLVKQTMTKAKAHDMTVSDKHAYHMEHGRFGVNKTHIPASHLGQVPFCGYYMSAVGPRLA